ncbi:hypothetical protein [Neorhizobium petrolearium]|uniref:PadR family transcriptional regulator n=1 Tax=Neorhizobium petrolearium TaxID=515361 RepID=A0ABY8M3W6_9HYPH|nr:hypothetical protein [Neorhizobium petrolearium]MCC2608367.1 hypothetical protein [Neorhizobium petrolearium]WGI68646.1 hypothetical protein QEO92_00665 [Neorhizobium petrolearium]
MTTRTMEPIGGAAIAFLRRVSIEGEGSLYAESRAEEQRAGTCVKRGYLKRDQMDAALFHITGEGRAYLAKLARAH